MSQVINDVLVSDQWLSSLSGDSAEVSTALAHVKSQSKSNGVEHATAGVILSELSLTGLLALRGDANDSSLKSVVNSVLQLDLPDTLQCNENSHKAIRWMTPDEWLISAPVDKLFSIEQDIRQGASGSLALINVTGGYTVLHLSGPQAMDVLKKSTPYDVHPGNFPEGKVVNTTFAKTQATIRALTTGYEVIVRRSFADYVWMWLYVAAKEYGLVVAE